MIDIHAHVFNVRSLPLAGIFESRGVIWPLSHLLEAVILGLAADDRSLGG